MPFDPNKLFEVEMTTVLKVQFAPNHFQPKEDPLKVVLMKSRRTRKLHTDKGALLLPCAPSTLLHCYLRHCY
ncbi:hypothetical protein CEXT_766171 [Caerostris extrusa]|uniref:Uncharacterized protein n=1 Tax=Caerostris extrusa TaxID=172846 RepID=A0AAV4WCW3_CAEEX|nr:hypothetical protein CEXT_766171 [Caerostris extrusa]